MKEMKHLAKPVLILEAIMLILLSESIFNINGNQREFIVPLAFTEQFLQLVTVDELTAKAETYDDNGDNVNCLAVAALTKV